MRYRLVRADIEGEIDMDLDPGPTTFCCIPRFVPHWYRGIYTILFDTRCYNGFFFRPVYNSSFAPPYRGIYTILFDTRCYNGLYIF